VGHRLPDATLIKKMNIALKEFFENEFDQIVDDIYSKSKALRKGIIFHCAQLYGYPYNLRTENEHYEAGRLIISNFC